MLQHLKRAGVGILQCKRDRKWLNGFVSMAIYYIKVAWDHKIPRSLTWVPPKNNVKLATTNIMSLSYCASSYSCKHWETCYTFNGSPFFWQVKHSWLAFYYAPIAIKLWKSASAVYTRGLVKCGGDTWLSHSDHLIKTP